MLMIADTWWILVISGIFSGLLAGLFGIGGGTVLVPILVNLHYLPVQSVATSSLAIIMTSLAGSWQNWQMGYLDLKRVIYLGLPSILTASIGAYLAHLFQPYILLLCFGIFLLLNIFLATLPKKLSHHESGRSLANETQPQKENQLPLNPIVARLFTGGLGGLMAGLFGIGGGVIMVPLQIMLLREKIKQAIQTSLGVIVITGLSACISHALRGNVLFAQGFILGLGGIIGSQISTRYLPKLNERVVSFCFYALLALLSVNIFWQAWQSYSQLK